MISPAAISALGRLADRSGVHVEVDGEGKLVVDHCTVDLPELTGEKGPLFGIEGLWPTVPRADDRDKLLWRVIAEATEDWDPATLLTDRSLQDSLEGRLQFGGETDHAAATVMIDRFFNRKPVHTLLPVHAKLPLNYQHSTATGKPSGYRMFNGGILPFLLWRSEGGIDPEPLRVLIGLLESEDELTAIDQLFIRTALDGAPHPDATADADALIARHATTIGEQLARAGGPFCQASLDRFREDLTTVLRTELPRPDKVQWITLVTSLHIAIRLYRMAVVKGADLDLVVSAAGELDPPPGARSCACDGTLKCLETCPLAGEIRFRTGTGRYRPVQQRDGCRTAYVDLDQRRLLDLPATLVTTSLASRAWSALGGGPSADHRDLAALAEALRGDAHLRFVHGVACAAIAVLHHDRHRKGAAGLAELDDVCTITDMSPGVHLLRDDVRRMRKKDLRHQSRDIINQLLLQENVAGEGSLVSRNGPRWGFFEIDEQLLLLLVRITCQDDQIPFDEFLRGIRAYGLAPESQAETDALAGSLERLGLLLRYSDAGEAAFVHYE